MNTKEAVAKRIIDLCNQKNIAINALANHFHVFADSRSCVQSSYHLIEFLFAFLIALSAALCGIGDPRSR